MGVGHQFSDSFGMVMPGISEGGEENQLHIAKALLCFWEIKRLLNVLLFCIEAGVFVDKEEDIIGKVQVDNIHIIVMILCR